MIIETKSKKPKTKKLELTYMSSELRYLSEAMEEGKAMDVYLANGIKLFGAIIAHDDKTITVLGDHSLGSKKMLVYKNAISTMQRSSRAASTFTIDPYNK